MSDNDTPTVELPEEQFVKWIIEQGKEAGHYEKDLTEEVADDVGFDDLFTYGNFFHKTINDRQIRLAFQTSSTVSERVARSTHWQPAEYKNHEVTVFGEIMIEWNSDGRESEQQIHCNDGCETADADPMEILCPRVLMEQESYPTEPTVPEYDPMEHSDH